MDKGDPVDQLAVLRAELDQMLALAPELARCARAWFEAFRSEGFTEKQAGYFTAVQMIRSPGEAPA